MPILDRPLLDRQSMGERPNEVSSEGQPIRDEGRALSIEKGGGLHPGAALDSTGSLTGTTIGHYLVGERLGGGAMAAVYRAHDQILDTTVAIKVLLPGADAVMQKRFRREARLVSTLVHPHIVRTLQVGRSGGIIYIAMELVEGASLGELLELHGRLAVGDAARLLAPVAEALDYAHDKGIVHRDVKPSNILLQRAAPGSPNSVSIALLGYPVIPLLSDFGIARALDAPELTSAGRTIGTPAFMAPEQCAGSAEIDGRADVYALGAVLYRCLVGRPPFAGTTTQILHAHVYDPLLIPDAIAEALPAPMVRVMARAMMKEPSQRFERIEQMARELQSVAQLPEAALPAPSPELADPTMTMASLPVAQSPVSSTSRVLVPAVRLTQPAPVSRPSPLKPVPRATASVTTQSRSIPIALPPKPRTRSRRSQWGMMALVGAFSVLVILAVAMLVNSVWPGRGEGDPLAGDATPTPAAVAQNGTPQLPVVEPDVSPDAPGVAVTPDGGEQSPGQASRATAEPTPTGPTPTPQPPIRDLEPKWNEAQTAYAEGAWADALDALILIKRSMEVADLEFEDQIDTQRLQEMLTISYVGLAMEAVGFGKWDDAITQLNKAKTLAPGVDALANMVDVLTELAELKGDTGAEAQKRRNTLRDALAGLFETFANRLEREGRLCDAVIQVDHALQLTETEGLQALQTRLRGECESQDAGDAIVELGGSILYSTGGEGTPYAIWRLPMARSNSTAIHSTQVIGNGAQPRLSPNGMMLAYYSRADGADGLYGIGMSVGLTQLGEPIHLSPFPEDSRDSPPSWNPSNTQLAYSTFRGNAERVYITSATTDTSARDLGFGKDPAWSPLGDVIVFNGPDTAGQNPGLRAMSAKGDGADRWAPTSQLNGNDQRPMWTSDGKYVVFMSRDREGGTSWEVYRLEWATGIVTLLTDGNPKQDGLPAISPDDKWVVFMSDRDGVWKLYYVSIDGGPVHLLSEINGQPISWLEHAIQWVE